MGNWNITIRGIGAHHNHALAIDYDANKMAAEFVEKLRAAGHTVVAASFTHGGENDITDGTKHLDECRRSEEWERERRSKPT